MSGSIRVTLPLGRGRLDDVVWRSLAGRLLRSSPIEIQDASVRITKSSGTRTRGTVRVRNPAAYREVLRAGTVGLGRTYAAGWWEADDLVWVLRLLTRRLARPVGLRGRLLSLPGLARGARRRRRAGKHQDRLDVRAHYDLGDDFFAMFLDPTLTYSCAYFTTPGMTLEQASVAKLERICELAEIGPDDEVMEIGTGWGSFALHAAERHGCSVTTTTVSARQFDFAQKRVAERGLESMVTLLDLDYRELSGQFDKVVSIEMIEAVGWRQLDAFFGSCARLLRPGGIAVVQAIVIDDRLFETSKRRIDFIKSEIFPGSSIPSARSISDSARRAGLRMVESHDLGLHYSETLARWRRRLHEPRDSTAMGCFDDSFLRLWDFYLAYCEAGFSERRISAMHFVFEAPGAVRRRAMPA